MDTDSRIAYIYLDSDGNLVAAHTVTDRDGKQHTNRTIINADDDATAANGRPARQRAIAGRGAR